MNNQQQDSKQPVNLYPGLNDIYDVLEELPLNYSKYMTLWKEIDAKCINSIPLLNSQISDFLTSLDTDTADGDQLLAINSVFQELMPSIEEKLHVSSIALESIQQITERMELAYEVCIKNEEVPVKLRLGNDNHPATHLHDELMKKAEKDAATMNANGGFSNGNGERRGNTRSAAAAAAAAAAATAAAVVAANESATNSSSYQNDYVHKQGDTNHGDNKENDSYSNKKVSRKRQRTSKSFASEDSIGVTDNIKPVKKRERKKRATLKTTAAAAAAAASSLPASNTNGSKENSYTATQNKKKVLSSSNADSTTTNKNKNVTEKRKNKTSNAEDSSEVGKYEHDGHEEEDEDEDEEGEEELYCSCRSIAYGDMIACDYKDCKYEWFHLACIGLTKLPKGKWYCNDCLPLVNGGSNLS